MNALSKTMTVTEAMVTIGISRNTLIRWIRLGKLSAVKTPGGYWRINRESVRALCDELSAVG